MGGACGGAGATGEVGVYGEEDVFWSETSQAVGRAETPAGPARGVAACREHRSTPAEASVFYLSVAHGHTSTCLSTLLRSYCGRCCLGRRGPLHRSPHIGPG